MQIIKSLLKFYFFIFPIFSTAQSTYLPRGDKGYWIADRLDVMQPLGREINYSALQPYNRRNMVARVEFIDSLYREGVVLPNGVKFNRLTRVDQYNMEHFLLNNTEWVSGSKLSFASIKPLFKSLYVTKANMLEVKSNDFF